jgi:hypothetical protein
MRLSEKLHIVIPLYESSDVAPIIAYVHSAPISREVYQAHFMLLGRVFAAIYSSGLGPVAGPRVAHMLLNKVAKEQGDELGGIALMNEIRRLTNVMLRTEKGWEAFGYEDVANHGLVDPDDLDEVSNAIVFFTVLSSTHRKAERRGMMDGAAKLWGAQITSSDFTAFASSLPTLTQPIATIQQSAGSSPVY